MGISCSAKNCIWRCRPTSFIATLLRLASVFYKHKRGVNTEMQFHSKDDNNSVTHMHLLHMDNLASRAILHAVGAVHRAVPHLAAPTITTKHNPLTLSEPLQLCSLLPLPYMTYGLVQISRLVPVVCPSWNHVDIHELKNSQYPCNLRPWEQDGCRCPKMHMSCPSSRFKVRRPPPEVAEADGAASCCCYCSTPTATELRSNRSPPIDAAAQQFQQGLTTH